MVTETLAPPHKVRSSWKTRHQTVVNECDKCCKGMVLGTERGPAASEQYV